MCKIKTERDEIPIFLLQMAGSSGTGKSTLAAALAKRVEAVVIDYDIVKSAALDAGTNWEVAGRIGYETSRALAASLLEQGRRVILDSPCRFQQIVDDGMAIATNLGIPYAFIECTLADESEIRRRMLFRPRQRSQRIAFDIPPPDAPFDAMRTAAGTIKLPQTVYPPSAWIRIDTNPPLEEYIHRALNYLEELCNRQ